jgi:hypothetical protein
VRTWLEIQPDTPTCCLALHSECRPGVGYLLRRQELLWLHSVASPPLARTRPDQVGASEFTRALSAFSPIERSWACDDASCFVFLWLIAQRIVARNSCSRVPTTSRVFWICSSSSDALGRRVRFTSVHLLSAAFLCVLRDVLIPCSRHGIVWDSEADIYIVKTLLHSLPRLRHWLQIGIVVAVIGSENHPANSHWTRAMLISRRRSSSEVSAYPECSDSRTVPSPFSHAYPLSMG